MNDQLLGKAGVQPMNFSENGGNKFAVGGNRLGADAEELRREKKPTDRRKQQPAAHVERERAV